MLLCSIVTKDRDKLPNVSFCCKPAVGEKITYPVAIEGFRVWEITDIAHPVPESHFDQKGISEVIMPILVVKSIR